jgi:hypothetical protein
MLRCKSHACPLAQLHEMDLLTFFNDRWGGCSFFLGSALLVAARTAKVGWHLKRKI